MTRSGDLHRLLVAAAVLSASGALLVACRKDAPRTHENNGAPGAPSSAPPSSGESPPSSLATEGDGLDSGGEGRVESRFEEGRRDGGAIDSACDGASLSLLAAAVDPRCAVTEREWRESAPVFDESSSVAVDSAKGKKGGAKESNSALRQEARRVGNDIVISIVNRGRTPLVVPLRYHPGHPELAFSILAEAAGRGVFELAPPKNDAPERALAKGAARGSQPLRPSGLVELDAGSSFARVHSARIRLPPGGVATARLVIDPRIVKRLDRTCPDAGATGSPSEDGVSGCLPERLPKGHVVLHVGQLVSGIDAGEPARVEWDVP